MTSPLRGVMAKSATASRPVETLTSHLDATLTAAQWLRRRIGRIHLVETVLGDRFWPVVLLACLTHDAGKVAEGFQAMVTGRTRRWGERHEVLSLGFLPGLIDDDQVLDWVAIAVLTHHRALTGDGDKTTIEHHYDRDITPLELSEQLGHIDSTHVHALATWLHSKASHTGLPVTPVTRNPTADDVLRSTSDLLTALLDRWDSPVDSDTGVAAVLVQGAVTLSDHLSSAHGHLSSSQPLDATFAPRLAEQMRIRERQLRQHQIEASSINGHLLLRAPTGSGKTEAALLWASRQAIDLAGHTGAVPRVFYTLPYLSSINAMAERLGGLFGDGTVVGVAHSKAASYHLATATASQDGDDVCRVDAARKSLARAAATRLFHECVRVGTPYQLLRAALAGPAHSSILIDAANSVFVLDELHAYDPRRLGYTLAATRLWERLGGRVAVLSATLPVALSELFTDTLEQVVTTVDGVVPDARPRHRLHTRPHHLTEPDAIAAIRARLIADEAVLVVANNVAHALELYDALAPTTRDHHGEDAAFLLHSRFTRADRSRIETAVRQRFAAGPNMSRRPGLLVATQVVEVSLDLDFDALFTSAAPLEALLQRFGRVNRIGSRPPGDVVVHHPNWTSRRGRVDEFADGIYPREPVEHAWTILNEHAGLTVDEHHATGWLDRIYDSPWGRGWRHEVMEHRDDFTARFLSFDYPFDDRSHLGEAFDTLFDGTEAILSAHRDAYAAGLAEAGNTPTSAGRLLAEDYLIPIPQWAARLCRLDRTLGVRVVDGDYTPQRGLLGISHDTNNTYQPGTIL
ncbi:CRISPR-associated helicase/endonuclease Cas3 [Actinokineospora auranticolor]|uniref:CRISPR-associated endonuclease/helicase Cas3 n=1 Tax=Actinokineospora auranticolor TaxID=155976 RepID=A0A2S6GLW4_9PSEU|nr:CRISPR-associated helicase/endonuclease Cas3 [Actinokineospora auranticolor]PPK66224.1 CRISPR-associated endonuclease/helicase Cas3 [Actinokineospora auranticolor]